MLATIVRWILGILLLPTDLGFAVAFAGQLAQIRRVDSAPLLFLLGVTGYLAFHVLIAAPNRAYVFGHELTHAAAAWVSGGQVKGFKVGANKGSVATNKITAFIALAPYFIPVYAVLWAAGYGVASFFWDVRPWGGLFFFGLGATLTFHLVFTVNVLKIKQSDIQLVGPVLALALIVLANLTVIAGVMALLAPEARFGSYLAQGFQHSKQFYQAIIGQLF